MAVATAVGLWVTPFLLGRLGGDTYGLWLLGTQVIAYLLLMDLGIVALLPRETAYVTGRSGGVHSCELRDLVERTMTLALAQMPVVLAAAMAALWWMPKAWGALHTPLLVILAVFVAMFPLRTFQAALVGLQDLTFVGTAQFAAWAAGTLVTVLLVLNGLSLAALTAGWCVTQLAMVAACAIRLHRKFPAAMPRRLTLGTTGAAKGYVVRSLWVAVSQTAQVLLNGTDILVIGALLGPSAVVPYACTGKLIAVLANQPQAILQSAAPALSELRPSADKARMFQVSAALSQATLAVSGLVACIVLAANEGFVTWWVGGDQFAGVILSLLMLAAMLARHFNTTNVYALFCFGHERRLALTALADGVVTLGSAAVLVKLFGMAGAPLAALAGVLLVSAPLNLRALAVQTGVSRRELVVSLRPWALRFAIVASAAAMAGGAWRPSTFAALVLTVAGTSALYALAVLTPLLRSPAGVYIQPLIAGVARRVTPARLRPQWLS